MNIKVRDYVRLEMSRLPEVNKYKIDLTDFDTIYPLFEKILNSDTGDRGLDGLRGQLSDSIERIICTKIDRFDIDKYFPNVWGNYEPYIKKIIYLFDKEKYIELKQNRATFDSYLAYLDIESIEPDEGKRTLESECFFRAKQLRNNDSHECPIMSVRECYENLIYSIAAMYLATKKAFYKLNNNTERIIDKFDSARITPQVIRRDVLRFIAFSDIGDIFRLSDYCQNIKVIHMKGAVYDYRYCFNRNGDLLRSTIITENRNMSYNYKYVKIGNTEERIRHCRETEENYVDAIYTYNAFNDLTQIEEYELDRGKRVLHSTISIDYLADGEVVIRKVDEGSQLKYILKYNTKGLLVYKSLPSSFPSTFVYSEAGELSEINREDGTRLEVNRILNMLQFVSVNFYGERFIEQKWRIKDGKIQLIIHYQSNGITKGKMALVYYHE